MATKSWGYPGFPCIKWLQPHIRLTFLIFLLAGSDVELQEERPQGGDDTTDVRPRVSLFQFRCRLAYLEGKSNHHIFKFGTLSKSNMEIMEHPPFRSMIFQIYTCLDRGFPSQFDDTGRYPSTSLECSITTFDYRWLLHRYASQNGSPAAVRMLLQAILRWVWGLRHPLFLVQETTEEPLNIPC